MFVFIYVFSVLRKDLQIFYNILLAEDITTLEDALDALSDLEGDFAAVLLTACASCKQT